MWLRESTGFAVNAAWLLVPTGYVLRLTGPGPRKQQAVRSQLCCLSAIPTSLIYLPSLGMPGSVSAERHLSLNSYDAGRGGASQHRLQNPHYKTWHKHTNRSSKDKLTTPNHFCMNVFVAGRVSGGGRCSFEGMGPGRHCGMMVT